MGQALVTTLFKTGQKHQNIAIITILGVTLEFHTHRKIIWSESPQFPLTGVKVTVSLTFLSSKFSCNIYTHTNMSPRGCEKTLHGIQAAQIHKRMTRKTDRET